MVQVAAFEFSKSEQSPFETRRCASQLERTLKGFPTTNKRGRERLFAISPPPQPLLPPNRKLGREGGTGRYKWGREGNKTKGCLGLGKEGGRP